uniref:Uncharacterized protein n=1 Tax=Chenopodium quinoa TaxID=63459 RepID=A0A803NCJ3_CHEQI
MINQGIRGITTKLSEDQKDMLARPYTRREIKNALFAMKPWKAPGPNGVPVGFYQKNWNWIQDYVIGAVQSTLSSGWRIIMNTESLISKVFRAKYGIEKMTLFGSSWLGNTTSSWGWKGIEWGLQARGLEESYSVFLTGLENIWGARNNLVFKGNKQNAWATVKLMEHKARSYRNSSSRDVGDVIAGADDDFPSGFEAMINSRKSHQLEERIILIAESCECVTATLDIQHFKCRSRTQWTWKLTRPGESNINVEGHVQ